MESMYVPAANRAAGRGQTSGLCMHAYRQTRTAGAVADARTFGSERAPCLAVTSTVYVTWFHESCTAPHAKEY
jgi:hypothetical protein